MCIRFCTKCANNWHPKLHCLAAWHEIHIHGETRISTIPNTTAGILGKHMYQGLFEDPRARNYSAGGPSFTTCLCMGAISLWGSHHVLLAPYTSQPDTVEHRGIYLSPTLTLLGFTSSPLWITQSQSNYGLESELLIASIMHSSWAKNDETIILTFLIITQQSDYPALCNEQVLVWETCREKAGIAYKGGSLSAWWLMEILLLNT